METVSGDTCVAELLGGLHMFRTNSAPAERLLGEIARHTITRTQTHFTYFADISARTVARQAVATENEMLPRMLCPGSKPDESVGRRAICCSSGNQAPSIKILVQHRRRIS